MKESITNVYVDGTDFTVHYQAFGYRPATRFEPEEPAEIDIIKVLFKGVDVLGIIGEELYESIELKLMEPADVD